MPAYASSKHKPRDSKTRFCTRAASLILLAFTLSVVEIVSRILLPLPEVKNFNRIDYSPTRISPEMSNRSVLRNGSYRWTSDPDGAGSLHELNLYGFRGRQWRVRSRQRRMIFVGDSYVEGMMAELEETIPAAFRAAAENDGQDLEIMNMGVAGAGVNEYMRLARDAIVTFNPNDLVLVLFANDLPVGAVRGNAPGGPQNMGFTPTRYPLLVPRIFQAASMLLQGERPSLRKNRPPFPFLPAVPHPANPWTFNEKHLIASVAPNIAEAMKRGRFNPFATDELFYVEVRLRQPLNLRNHIESLKKFSEARSVALYVAYLPFRHQVSDYYAPFSQKFSRPVVVQTLQSEEYNLHARELTKLMDTLGLPFLDLTGMLREEETSGRQLYWDYDDHMRGEGFTLVGRHLYRWWTNHNISVTAETSP